MLNKARRAEVAVIRGHFDEAESLLEEAKIDSDWSREVVEPSMIEAIHFLRRNRDALTGERKIWGRTRLAYSLPDGGLLLLTRDDRIGYAGADGRTIREIPPPEPHWLCSETCIPFYGSPDRGVVLSVSGNSLYLLKTDRSGWERLGRLPAACARELQSLSSTFAELIPHLRASQGEPVDIVWPYTTRRFNKLDFDMKRVVSLMLSDGTWLVCDSQEGRVWLPRRLAGQTLGSNVDIYEVLPVADGVDRAWLLSSQGLLDWSPAAGTVRRVALPYEAGPLPVVRASEGISTAEGTIRIALLPEDGGTTYLLDTAANSVRLEGLINEALPITYWKQKPVQEKRETVEKALREAGLTSLREPSPPAGSE
jgi:hypothetical protein